MLKCKQLQEQPSTLQAQSAYDLILGDETKYGKKRKLSLNRRQTFSSQFHTYGSDLNGAIPPSRTMCLVMCAANRVTLRFIQIFINNWKQTELRRPRHSDEIVNET